MLRKAQHFASDVIATAVLLALSACGGSSGTILVTSVSITPTSVSVPLNQTYEFTATVNLSNTTSTSSTTTTVTWQVNGVSGGNASTGTIVSLSTDNLVGVYTAPATVPTTNNGQVNITAVTPQNPTTSTTSTSTTTMITSNTAVVTIGVGQGLAVTPATATVPAGGSQSFSAALNSVTDPNATWSVNSTDGGNVGTIDSTTGLYTAPLYPPPGGVVTITAQDGAVTATSTARIVYSDHSFNGPFAFSYVGDDSTGFLAVAGSLTADGNGHILSGIEDMDSFSAGASTQIPITGGTYLVGADGRTTAVLNTFRQSGIRLQFALTTNQHGLLIRFDKNTTGSGTIDEQDLDALTNSLSVVSGPYVFGVFGADAQFAPMGIAGRFSADGSGHIPATGTVLDANDNGTVTTMDTSLSGSYSIDLANVGSGRGVLSLLSTTTKQIQYTFYIVDGTHMHVVETDGNAYLAGDVFSAPAGSSFSSASLASGNYVFTGGGMSGSGAYTAGGVFASDGNGNVSGGVLDTNNVGTVALNTSVGSCPYATDSATGRIDLKIYTGSGTCPSGSNSSISEFAVYQTSLGSALLLELDANAISSGLAYQQTGAPVAVLGNFALNLAGQGIFRNAPASYQPHVEGQATLTGAYVPTGNLDINNYSSVYASDPMTTTNSALSAPDSIHGRGTAAFAGTDPGVTYKLVYYVIDSNTALLFDQDSARFMTGIIAIQY